MDWLLLLAFVAGARMLARTVMERPTGRGLVARGKEVIVVGAGDAAQLIVKEMLKNPSLGYTPIGLVDDDPRKKNLRLHNVRVLGTTEELPKILGENRPDEVLIAIPSASGEVRQRVVDITRQAAVPVKTLPGIYELISGDLDLAGQIRAVQVEDVLGREPVEVDLHAVASYIADATVLVTGAGGSIGSELCRQIARIGCKRLILVDQGETALFEIERELVSERGFAPSVPVLADAGNKRTDAPRLRALHAVGRLPRRRVQARAADGGEPARVGAQQHAGDEGDRRGRGRVRRRALRPRLDRQGGEPEDGDGPVEGALRVDRRGVRRARRRPDALRRRALRQRARLVGQRDSRSSAARSSAAARSASPIRR